MSVALANNNRFYERICQCFSMFQVVLQLTCLLHEDMENSQRGEGCSTVKEGGPFSLSTSPFLPYGGNPQQDHT